MRKINDMLKLIPPDELNGGITMKGTNGTDNNKSDISYSNKKNTNEIRLRRGTSGIVAAALVLAIGGGALAIALNRKDSAKTSPASPVSAVSDDALAEADSNARKVYDLINANVSAYIASGKLNEIAVGSCTADLAAPGSDAAKLLARSIQDRFNDPDAEKYFTETVGSIADIPETGEVFYVVNDEYKPEFVQWRSGANGAVGQYTPISCERMAFGEAPEFEKKPVQELPEYNGMTEYAHELYNMVDRMQTEYTAGEYPNNQLDAVVLDGFVSLDFDKREEYADVIWRLEQFNTNNIPLTGKVNFLFTYGNAPEYLEWTDTEGKNKGRWPDISDEQVKSYYESAFDDAADTVGCSVFKLTTSSGSGYYHGVVTYRDQLPKVFEWYEDFLTKNYKPVAFDSSELMTMDELQKVVKFDWLDAEKKQQVYIRTSDMKGANIYVNGRYYNVEDTSVLTLLDNGLPRPVNNCPANNSLSGDPSQDH